VCDDIFTAIKKATQQSFSCVLADWTDQPDAGFLLKRARTSLPNQDIVAIAIVEKDPSDAEMRDHGLDFLVFRPFVPEEISNVLARATPRMQPAGDDNLPVESAVPYDQPLDAGASTAAVLSANVLSANQSSSRHAQPEEAEPTIRNGQDADAASIAAIEEPLHREHPPFFQLACAVLVIFAAVFVVWTTRDSIMYLARTPEGGFNVLRDSVTSLFYVPPTDPLPVHVPGSHTQPGMYSDSGAPTIAVAENGSTSQIGVVEPEAELKGSHMELRKAADFPQPAPDDHRPETPPVHTRDAVVPESLRGSAPITAPLIVSVNPAQMLPVSAPASPPVSAQSFSEPVSVSEEAARALLVQSVKPDYPREALPQKLHGPVVLQAIIGRDGRVEDLKIIRGYFVLGKAAIDAVKQWRFQPYTVNGRPAQTQTVITIDFSAPAS
jgi:TonB family protein